MRRHFAMVAVVLACALAAAFPAIAWASADDPIKLTLADIKDESYTIQLASWDDEEHCKSLSKSEVIEIDDDLKGLADEGGLIYTFEATGTCDECRDITVKGSVTFYDADGNKLDGSWSDSSGGYDTFRQTRSVGNSALVPEGTVKIEACVSNKVGVASDLELTSSLSFSTTSNVDKEAFENEYIMTVEGDEFYEKSSEKGGAVSTKTLEFDYLESETLYASDVEFFSTVYLDDVAQDLASEGCLVYSMNFTATCGECRTLKARCYVRCYDVNNKELGAGQYTLEEDDYETYPQHKEYSSGDIFIPENTAYLKVECGNKTGTSSHLGLYGSLTIRSLKEADYWFDNTVVDDPTATGEGDDAADGSDDANGLKTSFTLHESFEEGDENPSSPLLYFTDVFRGLTKRVSADHADALFKSAIQNQGVLFNWAQFAYDVYKTEDAYWDHANEGFDTDYGMGHYTDLVYQLTHQVDGTTHDGPRDSNAWVSSSGLRQASNFNAVFDDALGDLALQRKKMSERHFGIVEASDFRDVHNVNEAVQSKYSGIPNLDEYEGLIYYTYVNSTDQRGAEQYYYYDDFIVAFYDFELAAVVGDQKYSVSPEPITKPEVRLTTAKNEGSSDSMSLTADSADSQSSSATNTITNSSTVTSSSTYGLSAHTDTMFKISVKETGGEKSWGFEATSSWTTEESFSFSESKSESEEITSTSGSAATAVLPPHTMGAVTQTDTVSVLETEYECPLAVQYKVLIIGMNGKYYDDGAGVLDLGAYPHDTFVAALGYNDSPEGTESVQSVDAAEALRHDFASTQLDKSAISGCTKPKSMLYEANEGLKTGSELISYLGTHLPFTYESALYNDTATVTDYQVQVYPLKPLAYTAIEKVNANMMNETNQIFVTPGTSYNLTSNISIQGYNAADVAYYGFMGSEGYWTLVDKNGNPLSDDVASIRKNEANGNTYLDISPTYASATDTTFHVVYHINDGIYSYIDDESDLYGDNGYATDAGLTKRATLDVTVQASPAVASGESSSSSADGATLPGAPSDDSAVAPADDASSDEASKEPENAAAGNSAATSSDAAEGAGDAAAGVSDGGNATEQALAKMLKRIKGVWDTLVSTYGINEEEIDPNETITEERFISIMYAAKCFHDGEVPDADPREEYEAFAAEAQAWAEGTKLHEAYADGNDTYAEAVLFIASYLAENE